MANLRGILDASDRIETVIFGIGDYSVNLGQTQFAVGTVDET